MIFFTLYCCRAWTHSEKKTGNRPGEFKKDQVSIKESTQEDSRKTQKKRTESTENEENPFSRE